MNLTLEEQETHINMTGDDRSVWHVYSDDPVMQRRIENCEPEEIIRSANGVGRHYTLRADQILIRKGKRQLSEATKAQLGNRLRAMRETSSTT